jgi:hypothetical protein
MVNQLHLAYMPAAPTAAAAAAAGLAAMHSSATSQARVPLLLLPLLQRSLPHWLLPRLLLLLLAPLPLPTILLLLLLPTWPYRSSNRRQHESNITKLSILYSACSAIKILVLCMR